jgi:hypothetical protein
MQFLRGCPSQRHAIRYPLNIRYPTEMTTDRPTTPPIGDECRHCVMAFGDRANVGERLH